MGVFKRKKHRGQSQRLSSSTASIEPQNESQGPAEKDGGAHGQSEQADSFGIGLSRSLIESFESSQKGDRASIDTTSSSFKLRLRKSLSQLFSDKSSNKSSPTLSQEVIPRITVGANRKFAAERSPTISHPSPTSHPTLEGPSSPVPTEEDRPPPKLFTIPSDAPPVPPSPTPEQLAFLESNKSRLSTSYHSHQHSDSVSSRKSASILERRHVDTPNPLSLPILHPVQTGPASARSRKSMESTADSSAPPTTSSRYATSASIPSASLWSGDDGETETTSMWSNAVEERANDDSSQDEFSPEEPPQEETETEVSKKSSPDIDFNIESERKIANARLCDVLRKLFGANGRVGITPACKDHLMNAREPKLLEISMSLRSSPPLTDVALILAPSLAAYADDYPHGKFYVVCVAPLNESLDDKRDLPLEQVYGGLASFAALDFPDNFFDVIVTGSLQFILTKDEWPLVLAECYRVLKPGFPLKSFVSNLSGWIDLLTSETTFQNSGPFTSLYSSIVTASLESKSMYPHPAAVVPTILHRTGFHAITRTHLSLPIFWRDSRENRTRIRNARTGEDVYMTMSEIGDRVSTLMYGFWEEIYGEFNDDLEDFAERNRVRKSEAEEFRTMCVISKIGGRKRGRISGE